MYKPTLSVLLALVSVAAAEVKLHPLFSNDMVLQRGLQLPVWGTAAPGEQVTVEFAGQSVSVTADDKGQWLAELAPLEASSEARQLVVKASNTLTVDGVVVGDVWLASGQSNMDSPLRSGLAAEALPSANDPLLRFFKVAKAVSVEPLADPKDGQWELSTPETAKDFSAVAYFFAREVRENQNIPVGVISAAWGGTPIKTWMDLGSFKLDPAQAAPLAEWEAAMTKHLEVKDQPQIMQDYYREMKDWEENVQNPYKAALKTYNAEVAAAKAAGQPAPPKPQLARPEPVMPDPTAHPAPSKRPAVPSITYNGMIAPLQPYGLKGILWYQGEADVSRGPEYRELFPRLISSWRSSFRQPELPFMFVQLPAYGTDTALVAEEGIPYLRSAQESALVLPGTGMAVTLDIGEAKDAHPDNKVHVGHRLALVGRHKVYGEPILSSGPVYRSHEIKDGVIRLSFDHVGSGLAIGQAPWRAASMPEAPSDRLVGFAIRGSSGPWVEAEARVEGDQIVLSHPSVPEPADAAYGWAASPIVNFYNKEGLPAAPFRTDRNSPNP